MIKSSLRNLPLQSLSLAVSGSFNSPSTPALVFLESLSPSSSWLYNLPPQISCYQFDLCPLQYPRKESLIRRRSSGFCIESICHKNFIICNLRMAGAWSAKPPHLMALHNIHGGVARAFESRPRHTNNAHSSHRGSDVRLVLKEASKTDHWDDKSNHWARVRNQIQISVGCRRCISSPDRPDPSPHRHFFQNSSLISSFFVA